MAAASAHHPHAPHGACHAQPGKLFSILDTPDAELNKIIEKLPLARDIVSFKVFVPVLARYCEPGQFVVVRGHEHGERIPLTIADFHRAEGWTPQTIAEHGMPALKGSFYKLDRSADIFPWDPI